MRGKFGESGVRMCVRAVRLLLAAVGLGVAIIGGDARAEEVTENTAYIPGFNLYVWCSLSDPRAAIYYTSGPTDYDALVPYQAQHVGRVYADQPVTGTQTFTVHCFLGDFRFGYYSVDTDLATLVFNDGESGTKQTPVIITSSTESRYVNDYRALGNTSISYQFVGKVETVSRFDYAVRTP